MYSKFFRHSDVKILQRELDGFLKELDEVTGQITNLEMFQGKEEIVILIIYNCWKKL